MSKLLLYCTKSKPMLRIAKEPMNNQDRARTYIKKEIPYFTQYIAEDMYEANGKIVAECDFYVEKIKKANYDCILFTNTLDTETLINKSCIDYFKLEEYLKPNWIKEDDLQNLDTVGYAIHIKNLHIFDKPKELSEFIIKRCGWGFCGSCKWGKDDIHCSTLDKEVDKAPQNMMYVYDNEERKILISIKPEWLCKILNGEKTIEVRKKVLKEMLE